MNTKVSQLRKRKTTKQQKNSKPKQSSLNTLKPLNSKKCVLKQSQYTLLGSIKTKFKPIISNNNKHDVVNFIQTNGMEIVYFGDLINIYKQIIGSPVNKNIVLSIYKTINIIFFLYSNVGMSWLEYFVLFPEGRDIFWEMIHDIPRLTIFITSFILLPKQTQSDWAITSILELFKNIGIIPMAYSTPQNYYWITNNNLAVGIIQSVSSTMYRKTLNIALIDNVKKYKEQIMLHVNTINKSNISECVKKELVSLYNLLENLKSKNPQISLYKFRNSIKNKNFDSAIKLGNKILKDFMEDRKVVKKHIFNKQNGGRFKINKNKI